MEANPPGRLRLDGDPEARLSDFGLARRRLGPSRRVHRGERAASARGAPGFTERRSVPALRELAVGREPRRRRPLPSAPFQGAPCEQRLRVWPLPARAALRSACSGPAPKPRSIRSPRGHPGSARPGRAPPACPPGGPPRGAASRPRSSQAACASAPLQRTLPSKPPMRRRRHEVRDAEFKVERICCSKRASNPRAARAIASP